MRQITNKYAGECAGCGTELPTGSLVWYERRCGIRCDACKPADTEALRAIREAGAERKAAKIEEWAAARERRSAAYQSRSDSLMGRDSSGRADWALVTQPGYIPQRAQANRARERAWEESKIADSHRERAASLRSSVRVAGDAEAAREARREAARAWLCVGKVVRSPMWGSGVVVKINKKTLSMRLSDGRVRSEGLHWVKPVEG